MLDLSCPHDDFLPSDAAVNSALTPDKVFDLVILGAGMMGSNAAYGALNQGLQGPNIAILDRSHDFSLSEGASRRSAGKFVSLYNKPPEELARDIAEDYITAGEGQEAATRRAHDTVVRILEFLRKGCEIFPVRESEFRKTSRTLVRGLIVAERFLNTEQLRAQVSDRAKFGLPSDYDFFSSREIALQIGAKPGQFKSGYIDMTGGRFHPGRYISAMHDQLFNKGVQFFLNRTVTQVVPENGLYKIHCDDGRIFRGRKVFAASVHDPAISQKVYEFTLPFVAHAIAVDVHNRRDILPSIGAFYDTNKLALYGQKRDGVLWLGHNDSIINTRRIARKNAQDHRGQIRGIFNLQDAAIQSAWNGVYYQSANELPVVVEESPGFMAAGGLGGYGNTLGQTIGQFVGSHLAMQLLGPLNADIKSAMNFLLGLPHVHSFPNEAAQQAGAKAWLQQWHADDEQHRRESIRTARLAAREVGRTISPPVQNVEGAAAPKYRGCRRFFRPVPHQ